MHKFWYFYCFIYTEYLGCQLLFCMMMTTGLTSAGQEPGVVRTRARRAPVSSPGPDLHIWPWQVRSRTLDPHLTLHSLHLCWGHAEAVTDGLLWARLPADRGWCWGWDEVRWLLLALGQVMLRLGLRRFGLSQETWYINNKQYTHRQWLSLNRYFMCIVIQDESGSGLILFPLVTCAGHLAAAHCVPCPRPATCPAQSHRLIQANQILIGDNQDNRE